MEQRFETSPAAVSRMVGDEAVIVDLDTETYFGLNRVGSVVWAELERQSSISVIADVVVDRFDVPLARAAEDVRSLLDDLQQAGLARPVA